MGAVVDRIKPCERVNHLPIQFGVDLLHNVFREVSTSYARLIGYDDRQPTILVEKFYGFERVRVNLESRRVVNITDFLRNRSVAVDKNCGTLHARQLSRKYS